MDGSPLERLLDIMRRLRDPETGCPWDREQTFASLAPHAIEEAYEVLDAVQRGDLDGLREELGDLLFQVVFFARLAEEAGRFDFARVAEGIADKLVRRHPHVFAGATAPEAGGHAAAWEAHKAEERRRRAALRPDGATGGLAGVPLALPALIRAVKLQDRAALVGFDWPEVERVLDKVAEEIGELREELAARDPGRLAHEVGDILLAVTNVARHLDVDPEAALHGANRRFERRYARMEAFVAEQGREMREASLEELEALWQRAKAEEAD
jgi:MazG family protein